MLPIVLEEILLQVENVYKQPVDKLKESKVTAADIKKMENAMLSGQEFDKLGLKKMVWTRYKKGTNVAVCVESSIARIVAILPKGLDIPEEWSRIFQIFGKSKYGPKWNVYMFGSITPRRFPKSGLPLAAEHLNGGYTQLCSTDGIFIYRLEEASRVLIHELLHAACQDPLEKSIPQREATIETWAELIFIALKAKGSKEKAEQLLKLQLQWVADTNAQASRDNNVKSENDYGWRYLNGRTQVYESLGLTLPSPSGIKQERSRFTHPELGD
jgi:hypothetical protein